jgi:hypothetical protein
MVHPMTRRTALDSAKAANLMWGLANGSAASRTVIVVKERRTGIAGVSRLGSRDSCWSALSYSGQLATLQRALGILWRRASLAL